MTERATYPPGEMHATYDSTAPACQDCGREVERFDVPLPAYAAPATWWTHLSEAEARACPGRGPVQPATT